MSLNQIFARLVCAILLLVSHVGFCQLRQAEKKMEQGDWTTAHQALMKMLNKDSMNVEAEVLLSQWFLNKKNPSEQIDSSYKHNLIALANFKKLTPRQKEKIKPLDSASIVSLRMKIDSAAFDQARQINTEKSYNDFLNRYLFSNQKQAAVELRDESAYLDAIKQNTYQAYQNYFQRYPQSHRASEAKSRYEKLLFETLTRDHKLKSYEKFVSEYPQSPYKREADKTIFEVHTASGSSEDLIKFIDSYPTNSFVNFARAILVHVNRETDEKFPQRLLTDSLKKIVSLDKKNWILIYKNAKYGFIDSEGTERLPAQYDSVDSSYKCEMIADDVLLTSAGLISRSGKILSTSTAYKNIGYGFLKVTDTSGARVLHKSGKWITENGLQDAWMIGANFLAFKKNELVGVCALNGRQLLSPQFQSAEMIGGMVALNRHGKKILCTIAQLASVADGNPLQETFVFDEVKSIDNNRLQVRNGSLEGIINSNLEYEIPLAIQSLQSMPFGLVRKINDQYIFTDIAELKNNRWDNYQYYRSWLRLKNGAGENLFDTHYKKMIEQQVDSLWFQRGLAFVRLNDSIHIHINSTTRLNVAKDSKQFFVKSSDSIRYFYVEHKNKKSVFEIESGKKLFTAEYDRIESFNANFFIVSKKNKKGIVNRENKIVLPIEYDALTVSQHLISLYKDKKFGLYDYESKHLIKPTFEKNLRSLSSKILIAYKNGFYGLIDWQAQQLTSFEYKEIQPWNETTIWAEKDAEWSLIDFHQNSKILNHIKSFSLLKNTPEEKIALVKQDNFLGVVSSKKGVVIPQSFSEIINLGNEDEPFYFTAKEVEEAGVVVVIYYDKDGKFLRKQVYEEEDYQHIVCEDE